jgi:hypothetical protein
VSLHAQFILAAAVTIPIVALLVAWIVSIRLGTSRRKRALRALARANALRFEEAGVGLAGAYRFALFHRDDYRMFTNVLTGQWRGVSMVESDYWYGSGPSNPTSTRRRRRTEGSHHLSVAVVGIAAKCPQVLIERQTPLVTLAQHLGLEDIPFESEDFNRLFRVRSKDRRYATALVDARMMEWLLSTRGDFGFEVHLEGVLVYCQFLQPEDVPRLLDVAATFAQHVPRVVTADRVTSVPVATVDPQTVAEAAQEKAMQEAEE